MQRVFIEGFTQLVWQPAELAQHLAGIQVWLDEAQLPNVLALLAIDVNDARWPVTWVDAIFNANTVHIILWPEVERLFAHIARVIEPGGCVCLYRPYNYIGHTITAGNSTLKAILVLMHGSSRATRTAACRISKR